MWQTYIRFRRAQLKLDETDLGLLYPSRTTSRGDHVLIEYNTVYKLGVFNRAADLLDDTDVSEVNVRRCGGGKTRDGIYRNGRKCRRVLRNDLKIIYEKMTISPQLINTIPSSSETCWPHAREQHGRSNRLGLRSL